jgi:hypothetical protein
MEPVSFVTIFLPLLVGVQPVELAVTQDVASVNVILDGAQVAELREAPWTFEVDFGDDLAPHRLEAEALDASGAAIGRAARWINLAHAQATVEISPVDEQPGGAAFRVVTRHSGGRLPTSLMVTANGRPMKLREGLWRADAPVGDGSVVVRAEATYDDGTVAVDHAVFGAEAHDVETQLTAVVIEMGETMTGLPESLDGWFTVRGEPVKVAAVETPESRVLVVMDDGASTRWLGMRFDSGRNRYKGANYVGPSSQFTPIDDSDFQSIEGFAEDTSMQVVSAVPGKMGENALVFPVSAPIPEPSGYDILTITTARPEFDRKAPQSLANAVAVAGRMAATRALRRAVVLIIGKKAEDHSDHDPDAVRRYLADLGVHLEVWSPEKKKIKKSEWGEVVRTANLRQLGDTVRLLRERLERQRVVWLAGAHLPQDIELGPEASGVRIAGR